MNILLAPDSFKGSLSATEVAAALALGIKSAQSAHSVVEMPLADGGEGSLDVVLQAGFARHTVQTVDSWGSPLTASYGLKDGHVFIEAAQAFGFVRGSTPQQARSASSFGLGVVITHALSQNPHTITLGVGGTAGTDGGVGMMQALGWQFVDGSDNPVPPGGEGLALLARAISPVESRTPEPVQWRVLTDVTNPLVGQQGAARVFAPQKGADDDSVEMLERGLENLAQRVDPVLANEPGTGAGGGLSYGAMAFLGATQNLGADALMSMVGFSEALAMADLVVTGEGSFDEQSLLGKTTGGVIEQAQRAGVPVWVVCGVTGFTTPPDGVVVKTLLEKAAGMEDAMARAGELLGQLGHELAETLTAH